MSRLETARRLTRRLARLAARRTVLLLRRVVDRLGHALLADEARRCVAVASARHDVPRTAQEVIVEFDPALGAGCGGEFTWTASFAQITLNDVRADVGLSVLHEIGHYIDIKLLGNGNDPASEAFDPRLLAWRKAVSASTNFGLLDAAWAAAPAGGDLDRHFDYLLKQSELFARSYCQWIVFQSDDEDLRKELAQTLMAQYPDQWTDADFAAIGATLDLLFKDLKWN